MTTAEQVQLERHATALAFELNKDLLPPPKKKKC